jgi:HK97 family phage major capsid protein
MNLEHIAAELRKIHTAADGRELTAEERTRWDALTAQAEAAKASNRRYAEMTAIAASAPRAGSNRMAPGCETAPGVAEMAATSNHGTERWRAADGSEVRAYKPEASMAEHRREAMAEQGILLDELSLGRVLRAKMVNDYRSLTDSEQKLLRADPMSEGVNTAGGFTVPSVLASLWFDLPRNQSVLLQAGARRIDMTSDALTIAKLTADPSMESKAENASFSGGAATFGAINLYPTTCGQVISASEELLQDSPNAGEILEQSLAKALAVQIDAWFLAGTGSAEPTGLLLREGLSTSGAVATWDDLLNGMLEVEKVNGKPASWIASPTTANTLRSQRVDDTGAYLLPPDDVKALRRLVSNQISDTDVLIGDFSSCVIGVRLNPQIDFSNVSGDSFEKYQRKIRVVSRMACGVAIPQHICLCAD